VNRVCGLVQQTICFAAVEVYRTESLFRTFWERKRLQLCLKTSGTLGFSIQRKTHKAERTTTDKVSKETVSLQSVQRGPLFWLLFAVSRNRLFFTSSRTKTLTRVFLKLCFEAHVVFFSKLTLCQNVESPFNSRTHNLRQQLGSLRSEKLLVVSFQLYWA